MMMTMTMTMIDDDDDDDDDDGPACAYTRLYPYMQRGGERQKDGFSMHVF